MATRIRDHLFKIFSGKDNHTLDLGRLLWAIGMLVYFALSIHSVWKGSAFDPVAWGTGFGACLAAGGAALWMKKDTEPESVRETLRKDHAAGLDQSRDQDGK